MEESAVVAEIKANRQTTDRTVTLIRIIDLVKLVRVVPLKRIGLVKLRELFGNCTTVKESSLWIETLSKTIPDQVPYRDILEVLWETQKAEPAGRVEFGSLKTALRLTRNIDLDREELEDICKALSRMAPAYCYVSSSTIEITQRPDLILDTIRAAVDVYPPDERPPEFSGGAAVAKASGV